MTTPGNGAALDPRVVVTAHRLLDQATQIADDADLVAGNAERLRLYYLAALRTAGSALAVLESQRSGPRGQRNAWIRIRAQSRAVVDDGGLAATADYFAGLSALRQRIEIGLVDDVDQAVVARTRVQLAGFLATAESLLSDYEQGRVVLPRSVGRQSA